MRRLISLLTLLLLVLAGCAFEVVEVAPGHHVVRPWQPTGAPTMTPTVTLTPTPSATPTSDVTLEPPVSPTPTQEGPPVTSTPNPNTPEPKPALCEGIVINGAGLNVRADHSTSAPLRGTLTADDVAIIDAFYIVMEGREEWVHIVEPIQGWVAGIFYEGRRLLSWPEDVNDGERAVWCLPPYVTVEWASNPPPTPEPQTGNPTGLHLIFSAAREPVLASLPALGTIKATDGAEWALVEAKSRRGASITTVYRVLYTPRGKLDCPPSWGVGDPIRAANEWYDMLVGVWGQRGLLDEVEGPDGYRYPVTDWFEYRNECRFVWPWEVEFDRQMIRRASAAEICLLLFSDAPGTPEVHEFALRRPVLDEALVRPCRQGQRHGIALHTYFGADSGKWLFGRWRMFRDAVGAKYDMLLYWFTEYGVPSEQGTIDGRGTPDCPTIQREISMAAAVYRADASVAGFHIYSVGDGTEWLDLTRCLPL